MNVARTSIASVLGWGIVLACACGGSSAILSQTDAGSSNTSSSSDGSSSGSSSGSSRGSSSGGSGGGSGSSSGSASSSGSSSGGATCGECTTDSQCQDCATPPTGSSNCCQHGQGTCYVVPQPTCPAGSSSGGGSGSSSGSSSGGSGGSSGGSSGSSSSGTIMCGSCSSDLQCQLTCPSVQGGGTNCCEISAGICYAVPTATCPLPQDASAE